MMFSFFNFKKGRNFGCTLLLIGVIFITLSPKATIGGTNQIEPVIIKLNVNDFSQYYPSYNHITNGYLSVPKEVRRVSSPDGTKRFVVLDLTDSKTPYERTRSDIIVLDNDEQKWCMAASGFKNLYVDWITEEILKIEIYPGSGNSLKLTELINVETGEVLFKSAIRYQLPFPKNPPPH
jgi:hypothetical protein